MWILGIEKQNTFDKLWFVCPATCRNMHSCALLHRLNTRSFEGQWAQCGGQFPPEIHRSCHASYVFIVVVVIFQDQKHNCATCSAEWFSQLLTSLQYRISRCRYLLWSRVSRSMSFFPLLLARVIFHHSPLRYSQLLYGIQNGIDFKPKSLEIRQSPACCTQF